MMKKNGFTLVEIMIVVAILGILVTLGTPGFLRSRNKARQNTCITNLRMIENAADQYRIDYSLSLTEVTDIVDFWPSAAGTKSVSSYINKKLLCPGNGVYVGGKNGANNLNATKTVTTIEANGFPHCYDGTTDITNKGTNDEHSIEFADQ